MAKTQVALGDQVYLWTNGNNGAGYAPKVIISAHGWYKAADQPWAPGASTLVFFVDHGNTLDDIGSAQTVKGLRRKQTVPGDNVVSVTDYTLGKYQEHSGDIAAFAKQNNMTVAEADNDMGMMGAGETYSTFRHMVDARFDYVTVRNRARYYGGPTIKLSALVELVRAENAYTEYFCAFCRELKA